MTFYGTLRTILIKALPVFLAMLATALVLLFFPMLPASKSKEKAPETHVNPVHISTSGLVPENNDNTVQNNSSDAVASTPRIAKPLPQITFPAAPPSTPDFQLPPVTVNTLPSPAPSVLDEQEPPATITETLPSTTANAVPQTNISNNASNGHSTTSGNTTGTGSSTGYGNSTNGNPPILLKKVEPIYPERSRRLGQEGYVIVRFEVDVNGKVKNPTIHEAVPNGHFERATINAIRQWRFQAAKDETGQPTTYRLQVRIDFRLKQ